MHPAKIDQKNTNAAAEPGTAQDPLYRLQLCVRFVKLCLSFGISFSDMFWRSTVTNVGVQGTYPVNHIVANVPVLQMSPVTVWNLGGMASVKCPSILLRSGTHIQWNGTGNPKPKVSSKSVFCTKRPSPPKSRQFSVNFGNPSAPLGQTYNFWVQDPLTKTWINCCICIQAALIGSLTEVGLVRVTLSL